MEQRQRTDDVVFLGKQQPMPEPAVVDHAGIQVLRDLRHAGRAAGVEIGGHTVGLGILEGQLGRLLGHFLVQAFDIRMRLAVDLGPDERHDPGFGRRQVAVEIDLQDGVHARRVAHGLGDLLCHVGLRKRLQRDDDLGPGLAQDRADLLGLQKRVDRVGDARDRAAQQRIDRLVGIGQDIGHHVLLADAE